MANLERRDEEQIVRKDTNESPTAEKDTVTKQSEPVGTSEALRDDDINGDDVNVLPGTGGPDDVGDVEVDPRELNL